MDPVDTVTAALSHWCAREGVVGLRLGEVLPKQAADHRYVSLLFWEGFHGEDTARRFAEYLRAEHPELGGPHLVFMEERAYDHPSDEQAAAFVAEHARDFAMAYLDHLARTRRAHGLRVADDFEIFEYTHDVDDPESETGEAYGARLWIERDPATASDGLDPHEVAAALDRAYGYEPRVRVRPGVWFAARG
jgi:hypothetical protein